MPVPVIDRFPATLHFNGIAGGGPADSQIIHVLNTGDDPLTVQVSDDAAWLTVAPITSNAPTDLIVTALPAALAVGTYTATITINGLHASNTPQTVAVTFVVVLTPGSALVRTPASLTFNKTAGGAEPPSQNVLLSNGGSGSITYTVSDDASWLTVTPSSGSVPQTLTVTAAQGALPNGSYSATITVTSPTATTGSPQFIPVSFNIATTGDVLAVTPASMTFVMADGGSAPPSQSLFVNNSAVVNLSVSPTSLLFNKVDGDADPLSKTINVSAT